MRRRRAARSRKPTVLDRECERIGKRRFPKARRRFHHLRQRPIAGGRNRCIFRNAVGGDGITLCAMD